VKVRISYTVDITPEYRRAIARYRSGKTRKATREEIVRWFTQYGESMDNVVLGECGDEAWAQRVLKKLEVTLDRLERKRATPEPSP
jgi:hypothetical protein